MRRSDIRNSTFIIMTFVIIAFIIMSVLRRREEIPSLESKTERSFVVWSDTITNEMSESDSLHQMDVEWTQFRNKWDIKGISLAVTRNDSLIFAKGYGWADIEDSVAMTPKTVMRIASASKLVTAAAIMKLVEQGLVRLDSKVFGEKGILNDRDFTNAIGDKRIYDITIDDLLQHKGGFTLRAGDPMFNTAEIIEAKRLKKAPDNHELTKIVLGRRLGFQPGNGRRYSNFGYMLLSLVIEKVSGKSYWDYVTYEILEPSGAYQFKPATNYLAERHDNETKYFGPDNEKVREYNGSGRLVDRVYGGSNINGLLGAGGWVTTASDFARFITAIDGDPGVKDILSPSSIQKMTWYESKDKQTRGWTDSDGKGKWTRTGTLSSTHAYAVRYPDGESWVVLTNSGVWTGHNFSKELARMVERLRNKYKEKFPSRNLWKDSL